MKPELNQIITKEPIVPIDIYAQFRAADLLGHILRSENEDPMKRATLDIDGDFPNIDRKNRPGRPYVLWYQDTGEFIWNSIGDLWGALGKFNYKNINHRLC